VRAQIDPSNHDQLFKELLHSFLPELLLLVAPRQAQHLKLEHGKFLEQETFTDFPKGDHRRVDVLYRTHTLEGRPGIVLVHVEVESTFRRSFDERMALYGMALYLRHRLPIFPIALFLRGGSPQGGRRPEIQTRIAEVGVPDFWVHRFRYLAFHLAAARAEDYLAKGDPLAAALAALMRFPQGMTVEHKVNCLKGIAANRNLNAAKSFQLANLVDKYLPLEDNDRSRFQGLISREENKEVEDMDMAWARRLYSDGRSEGEEIGLQRGLESVRRILLGLLQLRFGELPPKMVRRIEECEDFDRLQRWSEAALTANDLVSLDL
jgi:hypothetical protein